MHGWAAGIAVVVGCLGVAEAGEFAGGWTVVEGLDRGARRTLVERGGGIALEAPPALPGIPRRALWGVALGERAELGAAPRRGVTHVLDAREAEGPTVRAALKLSTREGEPRLEARFFVDGRLVGREAWTRAERPRVEILEVSPQSGYDPKDDGDLQVTVEVRGAGSRRLRVRVELPDRSGPRVEFYREALGASDGALTVDLADRGRVEAGEHVVRLRGRDLSPARRILLGGSYRLVAELDEGSDPLDRDEDRVAVAAPRSEHLVPQWAPGYFTNVRGEYKLTPPVDAAARQRALSRSFRLIHGRTPAPEGRLSPEAFARRLARAAGVVIETHGSRDGLLTYLRGDEEVVLPGGVQEVDSRSLRRDLPRAFQGKALKDLHFVVIYACETGRGLLPKTLIQRGADVVIAFDRPVATLGAVDFSERLFNDLSGQGNAATPPAGVRSLGWSAREASVFTDARYWAQVLEAEADIDSTWRRRLETSLVIRTAPGIDADTERAYPARYGNSTN